MALWKPLPTFSKRALDSFGERLTRFLGNLAGEVFGFWVFNAECQSLSPNEIDFSMLEYGMMYRHN